ncbi:hypothetical protein O181_024270 [Austropuccinia psidii MF-1]|uniref:Uncharacterized protein n=1 Tax=Austropuccinia psidii MF-1 TaxID=1389203 RepID=A0A9Q3GZY2_9BASI|nr:hypothetical protein [Austropuccinia psidii MF-1]
MSLKAQTHFNTISNVWVITPHGATQQFGKLTFVDEMTPALPPGHITPLPFFLSGLDLLPHPRLLLPMLSMLRCPHRPPDKVPKLPPHLCPHHSLCFHTPALTILTLVNLPFLCLSSALPTWLQCSVPSLHSRDALPTWIQCNIPSLHSHGSNAASHPYAHMVPSRHIFSATYHSHASILDP